MATMKALSEMCDLNMGQSPSSDSYNQEGDGIPFYQGNADFGELHPTVRYWCNEPTKLAQANDILISVRAPIGALNIATEQCCIGRGLAALKAKDGISDTHYVLYALRSRVDELVASGTGSTFKAISKAVLGGTTIPAPDLETQREIAAKLNKASELITLRKQQLAELDTLVKSRFVEMFGDIDLNSKSWAVQSLSQHLKVVGGYAFSSDGFSDTGIPVLRIGNINGGYFKPVNLVYWKYDVKLNRYLLFPGDLVISLTGTVGKDDYANVCILGNEYERYYLNQRNAKLELKNTMTKEYLAEMLKNPRIKGRLTGISRGVRQANVSNGDIQNLCVPIPPLSLQNRFADFVRQADKSKFEIRQGLEKLELQYNALTQQYFG